MFGKRKGGNIGSAKQNQEGKLTLDASRKSVRARGRVGGGGARGLYSAHCVGLASQLEHSNCSKFNILINSLVK